MLVFKGGTSLSKGFNLINRMSEDIDLILNWKRLGEEYNLDLLEKDDTLSRNQLNNRLMVKCSALNNPPECVCLFSSCVQY